MNKLNYGRGYVYKIQYHMVWCVKYRQKILIDKVDNFLKEIIILLANDMNIKIVKMETDLDHIHLLIECGPQDYIPTIIKILKGSSARKLFVRFPELKQLLWDGNLWNPSYFVATVSENTEHQIKEYIEKQKTKKKG